MWIRVGGTLKLIRIGILDPHGKDPAPDPDADPDPGDPKLTENYNICF